MINSINDPLIKCSDYLSLSYFPNSEESEGLINFLSKDIYRAVGRKKQPSIEFIRATGMAVAALLKQAGKKRDGFLFRSMSRDTFKNKNLSVHHVGYRPFKKVVDGLVDGGFLEVVKGHKQSFNVHTQGVATRFRATDKLIAVAEDYGIRALDSASHFGVLPRSNVIREPIERRAGSWTDRRGNKYRGGGMAVDYDEPVVARYAQQVHDINGYMADQDIQPAEWHSGFTRIFAQGDQPDFNWNKGARLYSYGIGESYQQVKREKRRRLTINGEATAEVDIRASYLTILHSQLGVPLPATDLYDIPKIPRLVVKIWVTITLGSVKFHRRWPKAAKERFADSDEFKGQDLQKVYPIGKTQARILEHLPLLRDWPNCSVGWGDLQFLESEAVIGATHILAMEHDIPALPLHDALLVPVSKAKIAEQVLSECFYQSAGVLPSITVKAKAA